MPQGSKKRRFGHSKRPRVVPRAKVGQRMAEVLFTPHAKDDAVNDLNWANRFLTKPKRNIDK